MKAAQENNPSHKKVLGGSNHGFPPSQCSRKAVDDMFKVLRGKVCVPETPQSAEPFSEDKGEIKTFPDKQTRGDVSLAALPSHKHPGSFRAT